MRHPPRRKHRPPSSRPLHSTTSPRAPRPPATSRTCPSLSSYTTQAEQLKPDWQEGWWYLGILQYSSNQYPAAIDAFTRLLQLVPTAVPAMALRGLCEFETAAYDDSLRDLEQAVAHGALNQPRNEQIIRYHLALLLAHAGRFQEALDQYRFFAEHQADAPDSENRHRPRRNARCFLAKGRFRAGQGVCIRPRAALGTSFFPATTNRPTISSHSSSFRYPSTPNLHYFYGFLLFPHDPGLAIDQFHSELAVNPTNETANALLALTLVIAGRFSEALAPAQRAYANAPDMEMAQLALGRSLAETGDRKRGEELLNQVIQRDPNSLEAHLGLVSIYSQSGNREEAARERKVCRDLAK